MSLYTPTPYAVEGPDDHPVLDGILVQQSGEWWLRVDGRSGLLGPVRNSETAEAGTRVCVATGQQGAMYVVWPSGGTPVAPGSGDKHYLHTQGTAQAVWVVNHNMGKYPSVTVLDSGSEKWRQP